MMAHDGTALTDTRSNVRNYWDSHPLGLQYVTDPDVEPGTPEFFAHIRPWMNPYKFPWILERIDPRPLAVRRGDPGPRRCAPPAASRVAPAYRLGDTLTPLQPPSSL